jgi:L-galactose dehydrogenase
LQDINEAEGIASVHEAFKLGINFFDSSPFYGSTKSETVRFMLQLQLYR